MAPVTAPYGTWKSPVTPDSFTERKVEITQLRMDGPDIYWVEDNPGRQSRAVLLRRDALGQTMEVLPVLEGSRLVHVATGVHGRGGKAYAVRQGTLIISDGIDNRVYAFRVSDRNRTLVPLTPLSDKKYGDFELDVDRGLAYAICEDHGPVAEGEEPVNTLVTIPLDGSASRDPSRIRTIFEGTDFVSSPVLSHDGTKLAWLTWDHPNMPWTQSALHVGALAPDGTLISDVVLVDHADVCVYEPRWTLDNDLIHVDDSTGWANFYRTEGFVEKKEGEPDDAWETRLRTRALHPGPQAFSRPHWQLGLHSYDNLDNDHLVCSWAEDGEWHIGTIRIDNGLLEEWPVGWWPVGNVASHSGRVIFLGDNPTGTHAIVEVTDQVPTVLRPSSESDLPDAYVSAAEQVEWTNRDGSSGWGRYYPPRNPDYEAPEGTLPPLLVSVHPVPTMASTPGLDLAVQYWTSRGFAVLQPDVRGSIGRGKPYRAAIDGNLGLFDVTDTEDGVKYLVEQNLADPERVAIRGGSVGALTVLKSLEDTDIYTAGVCEGGLLDIKTMAENGHKFESRYPFQLMGTDDMDADIWDERSPLRGLDKIEAPILFMHGSQDKLAPVGDVENTYKELVDLGKPVALQLFAEEGHVFEHNRALRLSWKIELSFYGDVWRFDTDPRVPVDIKNCKPCEAKK